jgi:hypothetical protein
VGDQREKLTVIPGAATPDNVGRVMFQPYVSPTQALTVSIIVPDGIIDGEQNRSEFYLSRSDA